MAQADVVSYGPVSLSTDHPDWINGATVTTNGLNWTLSLPSFTVEAFDSGYLSFSYNTYGMGGAGMLGLNYSIDGFSSTDGTASVFVMIAGGAESKSTYFTLPYDSATGTLLFADPPDMAIIFELQLDGGSEGLTIGGVSTTAVVTPEPATLTLLMTGAGFLGLRRKKRQ